MTPLFARVSPWAGEPAVLRIVESADASVGTAYLGDAAPRGTALWLSRSAQPGAVQLPRELDYLAAGDLVRVSPAAGELRVLYRRTSGHNSILLTERCNSRCIMCSQPPRPDDDSYLVDTWLEAVPLMDPSTAELGISGGEPTLLGDRFVELLTACHRHLPSTALHVLSNGRLFNYLSLARAVADVGCSDLMIGIPLYSDVASLHDFVVQARGAFDQTVRGIINLKRCGVPVEIRIVVQQQTLPRLAALAAFIARNLPVVDQVSIMGLEAVGFAKANWAGIAVDAMDATAALSSAVTILDRAQVRVSLFNFQLCVLPPPLRAFARRSISDWKREYRTECTSCSAKSSCTGFFFSTTQRPSRGIRPLAEHEWRVGEGELNGPT